MNSSNLHSVCFYGCSTGMNSECARLSLGEEDG
jgi:hypothetical protein